MFFSTPPKLRKSEDIRKVVSFLRAWGVVRAMLGQSITENDENLARVASYERYLFIFHETCTVSQSHAAKRRRFLKHIQHNASVAFTNAFMFKDISILCSENF